MKKYLLSIIILPHGFIFSSENINLSDDGAWCWFQDPRAVYINGKYERTYAQWMKSDGTLQIGSYDHKTQKTITHTLKTNWDKFIPAPNHDK
ncbi:MAG: hypothetical protein U9N31_07025 [Candidatus Marinimicrobia bacterium]|nr:hypothetical protein [Candidatus Neomarinimicrobiota bacterium]